MARRPPRAGVAPGKIRIIGGSLRNSRLEVPDRPGLRPSPERLRETLFNWLAPVLPGARVLDAFAGTGVLGIEALSRGAAQAVLIERDPALATTIGAHLERLGVAARARVERGDALALMPRLPERFDVVFIDPPFGEGLWHAAIAAVSTRLRPEAFVYVEHPAGTPTTVPHDWREHRRTRAGDVEGALYRAAALSTDLTAV